MHVLKLMTEEDEFKVIFILLLLMFIYYRYNFTVLKITTLETCCTDIDFFLNI
jgi:hypothetical protein